MIFHQTGYQKKLATGQRLIDETHFVPAQNHYGGFVYAGGTMAYTAAYWALREYAPDEICFIGCAGIIQKQDPRIFMAPAPLTLCVKIFR